MAVNSTEEYQNAHHVVVLPLPDGGGGGGGGGTTNNNNKSLHNSSTVMKSEACCLTSEPSLHTISNLNMDNNYVPEEDNVVDTEKRKTETPKYNKQDSIAIFISDEPFTRVLQRDSCLQMGGKFLQLLLNHFPELSNFASRGSLPDKLIPERIYDTPTNRSRKYKRSSSFNSRRVVLLFSVLSSMGTIILIYLTLRVRQMADGSINV